MSIDKFITDILNIDPNMIESVESVQSSDNSEDILLKLKPAAKMTCPYCGHSLVSNGFYKKKLIHSTLFNRKCTLYFYRRRYICRDCECTFSEPNPFASKSDNVTHETKINILKDLKVPSMTYSLAARRNNVSPWSIGLRKSSTPLPKLISSASITATLNPETGRLRSSSSTQTVLPISNVLETEFFIV